MKTTSDSPMTKSPLMMGGGKLKWIVAAAAVASLAVGWYMFRPELLFINQKVNEAFPIAAADGSTAELIAMGRFKSLAHETNGAASIHHADGKRVLRLTEFETSNGPDVHVYLVAAADATDNETVTKAGFIDLGSLKGNVGDQNYDIPADVDLDKYKAVTIWCARFSVNFGTAPLNAG